MIGQNSVGKWAFVLSIEQQTNDLFRNEEIEGRVLVITDDGCAPDWPHETRCDHFPELKADPGRLQR